MIDRNSSGATNIVLLNRGEQAFMLSLGFAGLARSMRDFVPCGPASGSELMSQIISQLREMRVLGRRGDGLMKPIVVFGSIGTLLDRLRHLIEGFVHELEVSPRATMCSKLRCKHLDGEADFDDVHEVRVLEFISSRQPEIRAARSQRHLGARALSRDHVTICPQPGDRFSNGDAAYVELLTKLALRRKS